MQGAMTCLILKVAVEVTARVYFVLSSSLQHTEQVAHLAAGADLKHSNSVALRRAAVSNLSPVSLVSGGGLCLAEEVR